MNKKEHQETKEEEIPQANDNPESQKESEETTQEELTENNEKNEIDDIKQKVNEKTNK